MTCGVHPACYYFVGVCLTCGDVLTSPAAVKGGEAAASVGTGMAEIYDSFGSSLHCGSGKGAVGGEGGEAVIHTLLVEQGNYL